MPTLRQFSIDPTDGSSPENWERIFKMPPNVTFFLLDAERNRTSQENSSVATSSTREIFAPIGHTGGRDIGGQTFQKFVIGPMSTHPLSGVLRRCDHRASPHC
jgi:hypothetical protein